MESTPKEVKDQIEPLEIQCNQVQNDLEEQMDKLRSLVEKDFERAITQFANEVDLLFDYITPEIKTKLHKYCKRISSEKQFRECEMKAILDKLKPFEDKIYQISVVKTKTKTNDLEFINNLVLFDDILEMHLFSKENKNTKVSLVNYLSSMYMAASFGTFGISGDFNIEELSNELSNFVESIKQKAELASQPVPKRVHKKKTSSGRQTPLQQNGTAGLFDAIMSNPVIMSLAADLTQDIQNQNLDPLTLMSSLMSGKPNGQINNIVSKITNKLETKLSSGELNKDALEQQAEQIMSAVQSSDFASRVPMLETLLQNGSILNSLKNGDTKR